MKIQKIALLIGTFLALTLVATPAQAQFISSAIWTGTANSGTDLFFGTTVSAYRTGTTATLIVTVTNDGGTAINVTKVTVFMDWGTNYTSTQASTTSPVKIGPTVQRVSPSASFIITFPVPDTTTASNLFLHNYSVIVEFTILTPTPTRDFRRMPADSFAVYSADQADDVALIQKLSTLSCTSSGFFGIAVNTFKTAEANSLCLQAISEFSQGGGPGGAYARGDFTGAKTHLQTASDLWSRALSTESSSGSETTLGGAVWGWGILLVGIAAIIGTVSGSIYLMRRRGPRTASTPSTP